MGLGHGRRAGASCRHCGHYGLFLLEGWEGKVLDAAGGGSKEEAESTLRWVIAGIVNWGYRSEIDRHKCHQ